MKIMLNPNINNVSMYSNNNKHYRNYNDKNIVPPKQSVGSKLKNVAFLTGGGSLAGLLLAAEISYERKALFSCAALGGMIGFFVGVLSSLYTNRNVDDKKS